MTHDDRFDRIVQTWLQERVGQGGPRYLDEVLATTGRTRQRPSWSSPARWLPIEVVTRPMALVGAARLLVVLALLAALAATVILVGSQPQLPDPFGEAGNGTIVYGRRGDLYALDVEANLSTLIVAGVSADETPDFSHRGSHFVFARQAEIPDRWVLMVANADGTDVRPLTGPINPTWNVWSPDDTEVLVVDGATSSSVTLYRLDGRQPIVLDLAGRRPTDVAFRPGGGEIVFLGTKGGEHGIYAIGTDGSSPLVTVVAAVAGSTIITGPRLSPDGRTLAYTRWADDRSEIHLVDIASGVDRAARLDPTSEGERVAAWSPDGTQLLFERHAGGTVQLAVASVDGGPVALLGPSFPEGAGSAEAAFSPDGIKVVARYPTDGSVWLLEVAGGPGALLDLETEAAVSWQRIAP